jgi:hypothetical protein
MSLTILNDSMLLLFNFLLCLFIQMLFVQNIHFLQLKMIFTFVLISTVFQVFSLDLDAVSWSQWYSKLLLTLWFMISWISSYLQIISVIHSEWCYICDLFLCCCTQTVLLITVVLSCSDFHWYSVSNTF